MDMGPVLAGHSGGGALATRVSAPSTGPRPKIAYSRGEDLVSLDARVQSSADGIFAQLKHLFLQDTGISKMDKEIVLDENGEEVSLKMGIDLELGEVKIWKNKTVRGVVHLSNIHLSPEQMSAAEVLLFQLGEAISQASGGQRPVTTWTRASARSQGEVAALPQRSSEIFRRGEVDPVKRGELNAQMAKDLAKCKTPEHAQRYLQMMRYGAVMMHEYKAGIELLKARYVGEKAELEANQRALGTGATTSVEYARLNWKIGKVTEKINLINEKMQSIEGLDGYAFSKMAFHASIKDPSLLVRNETRAGLAEACKKDIEEETKPKWWKAKRERQGFAFKSIRTPEAEGYAKAVARGLLLDRQREESTEFKGDIPLIAHLIFNPAMQFMENPSRAYYGGTVSPFFNDLSEEDQAYMSDVHSRSMMTAYVATKDVEASFSKSFTYERRSLCTIGKAGIMEGGKKVAGFEALADLPPWSIQALEHDLTFSSDGEKEGRYATINFRGKDVPSLSREIFDLRFGFYLATATAASSSDSDTDPRKAFMTSDRKMDYDKARDHLVTDWATRVTIRDKDKPDTYRSLPPLRRYDPQATQPREEGDQGAYFIHSSRLDTLKKGDKWRVPFTEEERTYQEVDTQSSGMNHLNALEDLIGALENGGAPALKDDALPLASLPITARGLGERRVSSLLASDAPIGLVEHGEEEDDDMLGYESDGDADTVVSSGDTGGGAYESYRREMSTDGRTPTIHLRARHRD